MAFGVTASGFVKPELTDIQTEINNILIATFGADVNLQPEAVFGQISGIFSDREAKIWQAMQDVYNSQSPDTAFGASLDNVGSLRGIPRLGAKASVIQNVRLFGTPGTLVPGNTNPALATQFSVLNAPTSLFGLNASVTLAAGQNCIQTIAFSGLAASGQWQLTLGGSQTGMLAYNISAAALQTAIQALKFASGCTVTGSMGSGFTINFLGAGTGGLMVQPIFVVSSNTLATSAPAPITITPAITQAGLDQASVTMTAVSTGPTIANAGTLTVIATPVSGLSNVLNTQDAAIGRAVETDNAYRARMATQLQVAGAGTVEAIRSKLLEVAGVTAAIIFENPNDIPDSAGRPPKSFECVVQGGADADIAETIWLAKPAGIETDGSVSVTITDSQGLTHVVKFSRPTVLPIYMVVNVTVDLSYPTNGDETVTQDLVDYINSLGIGQSVIVIPKLISAIAAIPGIDDAVILIGTAPAPSSSNNIIVATNEIAVADTGRVTVNHV